MSSESNPDDNVHRIVVFFDICSSTTLLEDLVASDNLRRWRNLHIALKEFLQIESRRLRFELYKFQGDGWILLFEPEKVDGGQMMAFLHRLCRKYSQLFADRISPVLCNGDCTTGLTLGMDAGRLVRIRMNRQVEYVGRPLNVAARLQSAIKQRDRKPAGKMLVSKPAFHSLGLHLISRFPAKEVTRSLQNISNGQNYRAMKMTIFRER